MMIDYWRQLKIFNPNEYKQQHITLIGAGSIGSMAALVLSKLGLGNIRVFDDDNVENHNIPNQMHKLSSVGKSKVSALQETIKDYSGFDIHCVDEKFNGDFSKLELNDIVIVATDNMASRKMVWEAVKAKSSIRLFIDARMGGEVMRIYTVNPMSPVNWEKYEKTLYSDEDAEELPCSAQSIVYNLAGVASFIANQAKKFLSGESYYNEIIFDYKTMMLETEGWK